MATLAHRMIGLFNGLLSAASGRPRRVPPLYSLHLNDHDLADLNLPAAVSARMKAEDARRAAALFR